MEFWIQYIAIFVYMADSMLIHIMWQIKVKIILVELLINSFIMLRC